MLFLFALFAFVSPAHAADSELVRSTLESSPYCENFVRFDDANLYLGFGKYRRAFEEPRAPIPGRIEVTPLGRSRDAFAPEA